MEESHINLHYYWKNLASMTQCASWHFTMQITADIYRNINGLNKCYEYFNYLKLFYNKSIVYSKQIEQCSTNLRYTAKLIKC